MLEVLGLVFAGFAIGTYGTLIGIGGGPLIVPFLILCYNFAPAEIVATSLCVVFFNVFSGTISYGFQKRIDIISGTKFGIATIPGALIGVLITPHFSLRFLEVLIALLLLMLAGYIYATIISSPYLKDSVANEAFLLFHSKKLIQRMVVDAKGNKYVYSFNEKVGIILSAIIGFIAPLVGVGGGVFHVPAMINILNFPIHIATATAHYQLLIGVVFALIGYISGGYVQFEIAIPLAMGTLFGAVVGAKLSQTLSANKITGFLAIALILLSLRLLFLE